MQFVPYRTLRNEPSVLRKKLETEGDLVITVAGKLFAVMIGLAYESNVEDILLMVSRLRAQMAVRAIRSQARRARLDEMTVKNIKALINNTRKMNAAK